MFILVKHKEISHTVLVLIQTLMSAMSDENLNSDLHSKDIKIAKKAFEKLYLEKEEEGTMIEILEASLEMYEQRFSTPDLRTVLGEDIYNSENDWFQDEATVGRAICSDIQFILTAYQMILENRFNGDPDFRDEGNEYPIPPPYEAGWWKFFPSTLLICQSAAFLKKRNFYVPSYVATIPVLHQYALNRLMNTVTDVYIVPEKLKNCYSFSLCINYETKDVFIMRQPVTIGESKNYFKDQLIRLYNILSDPILSANVEDSRKIIAHYRQLYVEKRTIVDEQLAAEAAEAKAEAAAEAASLEAEAETETAAAAEAAAEEEGATEEEKAGELVGSEEEQTQMQRKVEKIVSKEMTALFGETDEVPETKLPQQHQIPFQMQEKQPQPVLKTSRFLLPDYEFGGQSSQVFDDSSIGTAHTASKDEILEAAIENEISIAMASSPSPMISEVDYTSIKDNEEAIKRHLHELGATAKISLDEGSYSLRRTLAMLKKVVDMMARSVFEKEEARSVFEKDTTDGTNPQ